MSGAGKVLAVMLLPLGVAAAAAALGRKAGNGAPPTAGERAYVRELNEALASAVERYPDHPGLGELADLYADAQARPRKAGQSWRVVREMMAAGLPPTLPTWCAAVSHRVPGVTPHVDLEAERARYPEGVELVRELCAAEGAG